MSSGTIQNAFALLAGAYFQPVNNGVRIRFRDANNNEYILLVTTTGMELFNSNFSRIWKATVTLD